MDELDYDNEIRQIIACKGEYEEKYGKKIPVVVAGGIFDREDSAACAGSGRRRCTDRQPFVATEECDASEAYKQAYIDAKEEDVQIIQSPVGMPGRALRNRFIRQVSRPVSRLRNVTTAWRNAIRQKCLTASQKR